MFTVYLKMIVSSLHEGSSSAQTFLLKSLSSSSANHVEADSKDGRYMNAEEVDEGREF